MHHEKNTDAASGGAEAIRGQTGRTASDLHAAIMNLPCRLQGVSTHPDNVSWYKSGHRDARHAAAELALAAAPSADKAEPMMYLHRHNRGRGLTHDVLVRPEDRLTAYRDTLLEEIPLYRHPPTPLLREVEAELQRCEKYLRAAAKDESLGDATSRCLLHERANDADAALAKLRETLKGTE